MGKNDLFIKKIKKKLKKTIYCINTQKFNIYLAYSVAAYMLLWQKESDLFIGFSCLALGMTM